MRLTVAITILACASVRAEPQAPAKPRVWDRLHEQDGPVPGLPGFSLSHKPDSKTCGGVTIVTTHPAKPPKADAELAALYTLEFPTGLDFEKDKDGSKKKFEGWLGELQKRGSAAMAVYQKQAASGNDAAKAAAVARIVQISLRTASVIARAPIPADVSRGDHAADKISAYCDQLAGVAEPLLASAEHSVAVCTEKLKQGPKGWWNDVCR